jgi:hypothetical protein
VVNHGHPVFDRRALGDVSAGTQLGGYTLVEADDLEDAVELAKGCPSVQFGGGVQVGELGPVPPALAERLRERAAHG